MTRSTSGKAGRWVAARLRSSADSELPPTWRTVGIHADGIYAPEASLFPRPSPSAIDGSRTPHVPVASSFSNHKIGQSQAIGASCVGHTTRGCPRCLTPRRALRHLGGTSERYQRSVGQPRSARSKPQITPTGTTGAQRAQATRYAPCGRRRLRSEDRPPARSSCI